MPRPIPKINLDSEIEYVITMENDAWLDLLNSDWHDHRRSGHREDRLDNPAWRDRFLAPWHDLLAGSPEEEVIGSLRRLRAAMRRLVDAYIAGNTVGLGEWKELNGFMTSSPCIRRMEAGPDRLQLKLVPLAGGIPAVQSEIAAAFAGAMSRGDPARIKVCRNDDCRWTFYDRSKNRSRKWCESTCGNLIKVRRFRRNQRRKGQETIGF